jgi:hypothetical protein
VYAMHAPLNPAIYIPWTLESETDKSAKTTTIKSRSVKKWNGFTILTLRLKKVNKKLWSVSVVKRPTVKLSLVGW